MKPRIIISTQGLNGTGVDAKKIRKLLSIAHRMGNAYLYVQVIEKFFPQAEREKAFRDIIRRRFIVGHDYYFEVLLCMIPRMPFAQLDELLEITIHECNFRECRTILRAINERIQAQSLHDKYVGWETVCYLPLPEDYVLDTLDAVVKRNCLREQQLAVNTLQDILNITSNRCCD